MVSGNHGSGLESDESEIHIKTMVILDNPKLMFLRNDMQLVNHFSVLR
jgi:hypothetical protein